MRIDKLLCESRGFTRSIAGRYVKQGRVQINGKRAISASNKVNLATDEVQLDGEVVQLKTGPRYYMLHKPAGYVCANQDSEHAVVFELMPDEFNLQNLHTVGRLDIDTTGLLFISDDGQWSHKLTSPRHEHSKTYRAWLAEPLIADAEQQVQQGIQLNDEIHLTKPATLQRITDSEVLITISEGRYHQVKRMFAAMGNRVLKLHRESIAGIELDANLAEGEYRLLSDDELKQIN